MNKIVLYQADDGTLYRTEQEALDRDTMNHLRDWYEDPECENEMYGCCGGTVEWDVIVNWFSTHHEMLRVLLKLVSQTHVH